MKVSLSQGPLALPGSLERGLGTPAKVSPCPLELNIPQMNALKKSFLPKVNSIYKLKVEKINSVCQRYPKRNEYSLNASNILLNWNETPGNSARICIQKFSSSKPSFLYFMYKSFAYKQQVVMTVYDGLILHSKTIIYNSHSAKVKLLT